MRALFVLSLVAIAIATAADPPAGTPFFKAQVGFTGTFNENSDLQASIASWFSVNSALSLTTSQIVVFEAVAAGATTRDIKLTFADSTGLTYPAAYQAWQNLATPFETGAVLDSAKYTPNSGSITPEENPYGAGQVVVGLAPMVAGYDNSWAPNFVLQMDGYGKSGTNIEITIAANDTNLEFDQTVHLIEYPANTATFSLRGPVGAYAFTLTVTGGTDQASGRYSINATLPIYEVGPKLNISITEPTLETYENAASDIFTIEVPTHRESTIDLVVTVIPDSTSVTVWPTNTSITAPGIKKQFHIVAATPGVYTLSYFIASPWMTASGLVARSNTDFNSPDYNTTIVVYPSLNISINSIPRAYMINEPVGSWGGAYSTPFLVHIEKTPRQSLFLTLSATDVTFQPAQLAFYAGGVTQQLVTARALTRGAKSISIARTGADSQYFADPPNRNWVVQGPNPACHYQSTSSACWDQPACQWDAMKNWCSNVTLPVFLSTLPELFDQEESRNITLTLASPARNGLTVALNNVGPLVFNPNSLYFAPGEDKVNFTITGTLVGTGRVSQAFPLLLVGGAGSDAQHYTQVEASVDIRPKIVCVTNVPQSFFVGTESEEFTLTCDTSPEQDATFTPTPRQGIQWVPVGGTAGDGYTMLPGTSVSRWVAISTTSRIGSFVFSVAVTGTNAPRYAAISDVVLTVLPSGEVLTPPSFYLTAFDMSPFFNCDISVQPPSVLEVSISVHERDTGLQTDKATVLPNLIKYNNTKRNFIRAVSDHPGNYTLIFTVSGANKANYKTPEPLDFEVKPRLDGKAFEARTTLGYTPSTRCRIRVGFQSLAFKGQAAIEGADNFCAAFQTAEVNTTANCSIHTTEERCHNDMETNGNACVWHQDQCQFLEAMQGKIKQVAFGSGFTVLLGTDEKIYTIGSTKYGQLGHYSNDLQEVPMPLTRDGEHITTISAGTSHTMALSNEGILYSWGANYKGQLGQNSRVKQTEVVSKVAFPKGENITCISSGTLHSGALTLTGKIFMWGSNEYGQLGSQPSYRSITLAPTAIRRDYLGGEPALSLQCGEYHTMVGTAVEAYTFGSNTMGQLGRDGFDEWLPAPPVHYFRNRHNRQPPHPSWITGRDNC